MLESYSGKPRRTSLLAKPGCYLKAAFTPAIFASVKVAL
jgi:hypothetical protein